jgi:hypothetical protein
MKCVRIENPKGTFDRRSFRTLVRGPARVLVGCPKGSWQPRKKHCQVGMRAYEVIKPATSGRCKVDEKRMP